MSEELGKLVSQNEIVITLLGRIAFTEDQVRTVVTRRKQNPERYVDGYNACDGRHTLTEIAKVIAVTPQTLSPILKEWEDLGIVYEVRRPKGRFYRKLFPL
jgi:DNA-binding MarR family transcriptional regulator